MEVDPPRLYHYPTSFHSQKVLLALAEKGIPYRSYEINLGAFENYSSWFLKINPKAQVPVLEDDEKCIPDSAAIIKYLDDVYEGPLLMPPLGQEKWSHFQEALQAVKIEVLTYGAVLYPCLVRDCTIPHKMQEKMSKAVMSGLKSRKLTEMLKNAEPELKEIFTKKIAESKEFEEHMKNEEVVIEELEKVKNILKEVNEELKNKKGDSWLCGPDFTVADICLAILLQRLKLLGYASLLWEEERLPHVEAYYVRLLLRKTFRHICIGGASYLEMMRNTFGDFGTIAAFLMALVTLVMAILLSFHMAGKT